MVQSIREVMTTEPTVYPETATIAEAARAMRDSGVGYVLVERNGRLCGVVTDRDIVVRAIADALDPSAVRLSEICSRDLTALEPTDTVDDAVRIMREKAVRRLPVCEDGKAVGIVSLGDLAVDRDPGSALADISTAPPNT